MELFHDDGHLTREGLTALVQGELDELASLEASEHLSFCDSCLVEYLALLEDDALLAPEAPIREPVMKRIGRRARTIFFSRYATVAAAAALVLTFWGTGAYAKLTDAAATGPLSRPAVEEQADKEALSLNSQLTRAAGGLSVTLNDMFGRLGGNPTAEMQNKEAREERMTRQLERLTGEDEAASSKAGSEADSASQSATE